MVGHNWQQQEPGEMRQGPDKRKWDYSLVKLQRSLTWQPATQSEPKLGRFKSTLIALSNEPRTKENGRLEPKLSRMGGRTPKSTLFCLLVLRWENRLNNQPEWVKTGRFRQLDSTTSRLVQTRPPETKNWVQESRKKMGDPNLGSKKLLPLASHNSTTKLTFGAIETDSESLKVALSIPVVRLLVSTKLVA